MNDVTFLFGAGASCKALPIVKEIPKKLSNLSFSLDENTNEVYRDGTYHKIYSNLKTIKKEHYKEMINSINWLMEESSKHASIDTFAKKLWLKKEYKKLFKLKLCLSLFFTIEQTINAPDPRYDVFLASILENLKTLPSNIKIITWNYDVQLELAFSEFINEHNFPFLFNHLGVSSKSYNFDKDNGFCVYKLNGTTGLVHRGNYNYKFFIENLKEGINHNFIKDIAETFYSAIHGEMYNSDLQFAWEDEKQNSNFMESVINNIKDSVALVVIGYSFPVFNRNIDRQVLNSMKNLKRIYLQDLNPNALEERVKALREDLRDDPSKVDIVKSTDVEQFLIPYELS